MGIIIPEFSKSGISQVFSSCHDLQEEEYSANLEKSSVSSVQAGEWQDITLPANITSPGLYRVINDYSAIQDGIGITVLCNDVYVDGKGHTYTGLDGRECYGVAATTDFPLHNITVTNVRTRNCIGGVVFYQVTDCMISNTHHENTLNAIALGESEHVTVYGNSIIYDSDDVPAGEYIGIAGVSVSGTNLVANRISTSGLSDKEGKITGVMLTDSENAVIIGNSVTGEVDSGITTEPGFFSDGGYQDVSDNLVTDAVLSGVYIGGGHGRIMNNTICSGRGGMMLNLVDSVIQNNTISHTTQAGLTLTGLNLTLSENTLTDNGCSVYMNGPTEEYYLHHIDRTNRINGKPLIYLRESSGDRVTSADDPAMVIGVRCNNLTIDGIHTGNSMAGIMIINSTDVSISGSQDSGSMSGYMALNTRNCRITDSSGLNNQLNGYYLLSDVNISLNRCSVSGSSGNGFYILDSEDILLKSCYARDYNSQGPAGDKDGVYVDYGNRVIVQDSIFSTGPDSGMMITNSADITINNSTIQDNQEQGIYFMQCTKAVVNNSLISGNERSGISMDFIDRFTINRNLILNNTQAGLLLLDASDGLVTDNLFNNTDNVMFVYGSTPNQWNTTLTPGRNIVRGPNLGGNFWADPEGDGFSQTHADRGDGICNSSYVINAENVDLLPLAVPSMDMVADFRADRVSGTPPLPIRFTDVSSGEPISWNWTFGDGGESHEQDPVHIYSGTGRYTVTLEVTGEFGEQAVLRRPDFIQVNHGRITGPNGMLIVNSNPHNGSVFLDEKLIGYTPLKAYGISAGTHQIRITMNGYKDWSGSVRVNHGLCTFLPTVNLFPA